MAAIGQGSWHLESSEERAAILALRRGLDLGMTHIDTAELYGAGRAEAVVGKALAGRREEAFVVSKVMPSHASRAGTIEACERSLRYLAIDYLDCYLLHWPGSCPLEDTFAAFEQLESQGKIRSFGVSNFDEEELTRAIGIAGSGRIACNQVLYHLEERGIEHAVLPLCRQQEIALVGYTPFGTSDFPPADRKGEVLANVAQRHGATVRQVALAFLTRGEGLFAIPKSANPAHTEENAGAGSLKLTSEDIAAIERAFPLGRRRRGIAML